MQAGDYARLPGTLYHRPALRQCTSDRRAHPLCLTLSPCIPHSQCFPLPPAPSFLPSTPPCTIASSCTSLLQAAKDVGAAKSKLSDDYVTKKEFRLLLVYLRRYFELLAMFDEVPAWTPSCPRLALLSTHPLAPPFWPSTCLLWHPPELLVFPRTVHRSMSLMWHS